MTKKYYETVTVVEIPLDSVAHTLRYNQQVNTSVVDVLEFISGMDLSDQVLMITNLLTVSGYSQREIAKAMKMPYSTYRNRLLEIRKEFQYKDGQTV